MKKKMIYISGESEYGFMMFEDSEYNNKESLQEIWDEAMKSPDKWACREIGESEDESEVITFDCYEFEGVDENFIEFINDNINDDYDSCKNRNFIFID